MKIQSLKTTPVPARNRLETTSHSQPPQEPQEQFQTRREYCLEVTKETASTFAFIGGMGGAAYSVWTNTGFTLEAVRNTAIGGAAGALGGVLCGGLMAYLSLPYLSFPPAK